MLDCGVAETFRVGTAVHDCETSHRRYFCSAVAGPIEHAMAPAVLLVLIFFQTAIATAIEHAMAPAKF